MACATLGLAASSGFFSCSFCLALLTLSKGAKPQIEELTKKEVMEIFLMLICLLCQQLKYPTG